MPSALPIRAPDGGTYCRSAVFTMSFPAHFEELDLDLVGDSLNEVFGSLWPDGWGLAAHGVNDKGRPYLVRIGNLGPICLQANEMRREALPDLLKMWAKIVGGGYSQVRMKPCHDETDVLRFANLAWQNAPVPLPLLLREVLGYRRTLAKMARAVNSTPAFIYEFTPPTGDLH